MKTRLSLLALALCSQYTLAQDPMVNALVIEELVVTAQKREQSIQDVPASMAAVGGDAMQSAEISNFKDIASMTPGLSLDNNRRNASISMRGMSSDPDGGTRAVVDAYWNGLAVQPNMVFQQMYDVDRVEILRGAQGSLQGRTSPGGAIAVHTRSASFDELEGQTKTSVNDSGDTVTEFGVSLPIIEGELAVRVAGLYASGEAQGVENITNGARQSSNSNGTRVTLSWEPNDAFAANLSMQYDERDRDNFVPVEVTGRGSNNVSATERVAINDGLDMVSDQNEAYVLEMSYDLGDVLVTSITGYQESNVGTLTDLDVANNDLVGLPGGGSFPIPGLNIISTLATGTQTISQELRIASADAEFWDYMVGFYYANANSYTEQDAVVLGRQVANIEALIDREEYGIFLHNIFYINDVSSAQLGLRYQKIDNFNSLIQNGQNVLAADNLEGSVAEAFSASAKYQYDYSDDLMVYASLEQSFRPGGATIGNPMPLSAETLTFDEETSNSLELGFKSTLWDGRAQLSGAVYQQQFKNYIYRSTGVYVRDDVGTVGRAAGLNSNNDATITGAEVDFTVLVSEKFTVNGGVAYVDAKFDEGEMGIKGITEAGNPGCTDNGQVAFCDVGGQNIGQEPNWSASVTGEYVEGLGDFEGYLRGLYKFTGKRTNEQAGDDMGAYGVTNLYAGVRSADYAWDVSLWAKNVFNKFAEKGAYTEEISRVGGSVRQLNLEAERIVGVSASYRFSM